jgi:hypothetical protein
MTVRGTLRAGRLSSARPPGTREGRTEHSLLEDFVNRSLIALLAVVLAGVVAACGAPQASPETQETAEVSPVAQATEEATPEETPAETNGEGETPDPLASFDLNQDQALEELLPDEVGGTELTKFSVAGEEFFGSADPQFQAFLDRVGATADDVSAAFAQLPSGDGTDSIGAIRVAGTDTNRLEDEFRNAVETGETGAVELEQVNLGGKDVWTGVDQEQQTTIYFYAAGDVLFFVQTNDEPVAEEVISQLP